MAHWKWKRAVADEGTSGGSPLERRVGLRFEAPDGAAIAIETEDFPHWAVWTRPPAPFLSIESWTGHGDPVGFEGDIADKPSMRLLLPGRSAVHAVRYAFEEAPAA